MADGAATSTRSIDCPVSWCQGLLMDHGADGAPPDEWLHSDDGVELVHGAALYRWRKGTDSDNWDLVVGGNVLGSGSDLSLLAEKLRDIVGAVATLGHR